MRKAFSIPVAKSDQAMPIENDDAVDVAKRAFGFRLTDDQERCLNEILDDVSVKKPMLRILQGDVGTGKTIVAFMAMFASFGSGCQSALVVPTEILSQQHYKTLTSLIADCPATHRPKIALLTAAVKKSDRKSIVRRLADGDIDIIIGTHALFNKDVQFQKLALVIVDELHRFGVEQRQKIKSANGVVPHTLMMSATPIPRSFAMVVHGTMSVSNISMPLPGKKEVDTAIINDENPDDVTAMYEAVLRDVEDGGRAYIVFPLIEESESENLKHLKSVETQFDYLNSEIFDRFECGLVHGRMTAQEKHEAFSKFAKGETRVLVATTVIEVGMDVHEASTMIVYHPERFGLAQLHQLRGRVGRGERKSVCYLVSSGHVPRLSIMTEAATGEDIARADLIHRGPGDLLGNKQSGFKSCMTYSLASTFENEKLLLTSRAAAEEFLKMSGGEIPEAFEALMQAQGFPTVEEFEI